MAFYSHNPFLPQQRRQAPYGYSHPFYTASGPNYHYSATDDFDVEEQAALAHLASIRQRREAAELVAQREVAIRAQVAAQREAAIAAAAERERLREQAIRQALAIQEERRAIAQEQYRQEQLRRLTARKAQQEAYAARAVEENRRRSECARGCAGACHRAEKGNKPEDQEWKQINDILGSLFGIALQESSTSRPKEFEENKEEKKEAVTVHAPAQSSPVKVDDSPDSVPTAPVVAPATNAARESASAEGQPPADQEDPRIVTNLSDLASKFFGINIVPAHAEEKSTDGANALTARVNEFLSQFGLEFEPVSLEETKPTSAKGKEVAEGEKPAQPASKAQPAHPVQHKAPVEDAPAAAPVASAVEGDSTAAFNKLRDISHELHLVTESFTFPSQLAFAPTPSADEVTPPLLFNKSNSGYHAQAHKLLQLLLAADGVSSGGDKEVRRQRKAIVRAIEGAIERLEQKRDEVWDQVKERRNLGEESDDEGSVSSWATDSVHEVQHVENAESSHQESADPAIAASQASELPAAEAEMDKGTQDRQEIVEGFEVPTNSQVKPAAPATEEDTKAVKEDKDEFELL